MTQHYLATPLRRALERTIREARDIAEDGAADAIRRLGVADPKVPSYLSEEEKELRRELRAHARALGDRRNPGTSEQAVNKLIEAAAYAHWHRMLFARFLAERKLLRHPEYDAAISIEECQDLADEQGIADGWIIAEQFAASMLPAVFRVDDPVLKLTIDAAHQQKLHRLVVGLDADVFQAEDSLGWTYQFWRAAEKDAVNRSGMKIGADELPAVTQLFTEPYMVRFLLHNTLGAWWAGKVLAQNPKLAESAPDEAALRAACALPDYTFDMLRFMKEGQGDAAHWRPVARTYLGWPREARAISMLDPCCGSGHFLTEALAILSSLRQVEEDLPPTEAVAAVLRDNLHGLEIDGRCVQIAAFAVALTAWRIGGWQTLPLPHIAWVGAPPPLPKAEFVALAEGDKELERALAALHDLFAQAPILGSLLEPTGGDLADPLRIARIEALLGPLVEKVRKAAPEQAEGVVAARGMADGVGLLTRRYTLQATNVPFLGSGKQNQYLSQYIERRFAEGKADLATAMLLRIRNLTSPNGAIAAVSPQSWLYQGSYKKFRRVVLENTTLNLLVGLGSGAFETITGEVVNTALVTFSESRPDQNAAFPSFDANAVDGHSLKKVFLHTAEVKQLSQAAQQRNPANTITFVEAHDGKRLSDYADCVQRMGTGDLPRYLRLFTEIPLKTPDWDWFQTSPTGEVFSGHTSLIHWKKGDGALAQISTARKGLNVVGRTGVAVSVNSKPKVSFFLGSRFDCTFRCRDAEGCPTFASYISIYEQVGLRRDCQAI